MDNLVTFAEIATANGRKIGHATLNNPKALNALGIEMVRLLMPQLSRWQQDDNIVCVLLDGNSDKAFCAGGDVVTMYNAMHAEPNKMPESLQTFFTEEYRLDHLIHTYTKPFVVWGNGIVMGGGLGLMAGAAHRVVTESSRIAMPEITIGLYPDVGGSWFLNKMPTGCGLFLGLTGASINAADALYVSLADHFIAHEEKGKFIEQLAQLAWRGHTETDDQLVGELCQQMQRHSEGLLPQGNIEAHLETIQKVTSQELLGSVVSAILALDANEDKWLSRAQTTLKSGSPITMHLVWEQLKRGESLDLATCFQLELAMSCRCGELGEFQEGVRALLIDKDNQPNWLYPDVSAVPESIVESFFAPRWADLEHPLATLGQQ